MTIEQVIALAKVSELNGLRVAEDNTAILGFLNLGMLELYKRFSLKVEEYIIELDDMVNVYTMPSNYMWIVAAYGEVDIRSNETVNELPINEEDNPLSINTVGWNKVQVPLSVTGAYVSVIYVARPEMYAIEDLDVEVDLPPQMLEPLLAYIGYRANTAIDTGVQTEDNAWYIRFENSCTKIRQESMVNSDDMFMTNRLSKRGFI
jgi:hypothetical protein